jgi:hypothetical protein
VQLETVDVAKFPQAAYARPAATSPDARPIKTSKRAGHPTMAGQDGSENPCARPKTPPERKPPVRKTPAGQGLVQTQGPVEVWIKNIPGRSDADPQTLTSRGLVQTRCGPHNRLAGLWKQKSDSARSGQRGPQSVGFYGWSLLLEFTPARPKCAVYGDPNSDSQGLCANR